MSNRALTAISAIKKYLLRICLFDVVSWLWLGGLINILVRDSLIDHIENVYLLVHLVILNVLVLVYVNIDLDQYLLVILRITWRIGLAAFVRIIFLLRSSSEISKLISVNCDLRRLNFIFGWS